MYANYRAHSHRGKLSSKMPPTRYKLTYFNGKGRAEITRLLFAAGGVSYEDCRLEFKDWPALKPNTPFGSLPILEVDGVVLGQSNAIARFVAKELGVAGKTNVEQEVCDAVVDSCEELIGKAIEMAQEKDEKRKEGLEKDFMEKKLPTNLACLEKILKANNGGKGWIVGKSMTWADVHLYNILEQVTKGNLDALKAVPLLDGLFKRVSEQPKIAAYVKARAVTPF